MTVKNIISIISATDDISVQDKNGRIYNGLNGDFKAICEWAYEVLDCKVDRIRSYNNITIILL